jgi:putative FmdB family regulatory protein
MPTYEYECPKCPRVFEVRQRITEPALETCDRCGGPIHRLLSPAPFILKGEGWYVTDYPSDARKKATSAESTGKETTTKESSSAKDGGSAEAKPAASSESKSSTDSTAASASSSGKTSGSGKASGSPNA